MLKAFNLVIGIIFLKCFSPKLVLHTIILQHFMYRHLSQTDQLRCCDLSVFQAYYVRALAMN